VKSLSLSPILLFSILGTGLSALVPEVVQAQVTQAQPPTILAQAEFPGDQPSTLTLPEPQLPPQPTPELTVPGQEVPPSEEAAPDEEATPEEGKKEKKKNKKKNKQENSETESQSAPTETPDPTLTPPPSDSAPIPTSPANPTGTPDPSLPPPAAPAEEGSSPNPFSDFATPDSLPPEEEGTPLPPGATPPTPESPESAAPDGPEPQVLVSEVVVEGAEGDLVNTVYQAISTRPGQATTRSQLQADKQAIFATGYFSRVQAVPSDTPLGVRVTYIVEPNPVLRRVQVAGNKVLTAETVDEIFANQYGKILNLRDLQTGIEAINKYYQDTGYVLAQVLDVPQIDLDGTVTLQVAEGEIEAIGVRYQTEEGEPKKGKTKEYVILRELKTKPGDVLNRDELQKDLQRVFGLGLFEDVQVALEPGEDPRKVAVNLNVQERKTGSFSPAAGFSSRSGFFGTATYSQSNFRGRNQKINVQVQGGSRDLLFDASFTDPWIKGDPYRTSYTVNAFNRITLPLVFDGGVFTKTILDDVQPRFRYRQDAEGNFVQDPKGEFIGFKPNPNYNPNNNVSGSPSIPDRQGTNRQYDNLGKNPSGDDVPSSFDDFVDNPDCGVLKNPGAKGSPCDVRLVDNDKNKDTGGRDFDGKDTPRINRLGGGVTFTRPLTKDPDKLPRAWVVSAGVRYERVTAQDSDFDKVPTDELGNPLTFSGVKQLRDGGPNTLITRAQDDLLSFQVGVGRDLRDDPLTATKGNAYRFGVEQTVPVGSGAITFTRLRASYSHFFPVKLLKKEGPQTLAFNVQGGAIIGDLPPYEAFTIGGSNSIRGFNDGDVGSGRAFMQATAEYRFPLLKFLGGIGGVVFVDYGSVLGSDSDVPGQPSIIRGKPGDGLGFGAGIRVKTPIGPVRIDYAINQDGEDRFHFGFGERF
jgi:outer membrane protein assembly factor BamA